MKKLLLFALVLTVAAGCKRKQDLVEPEGTLAKHPAHCYNQLLDGNESGIDCGGDCDPCNIPTPTCTPASNTIKIGTSTYSSVGSTCGASGSEFEMTGTYSSGSYSVNLGSSTPDLSVAYTIINSSIPNTNEAYVNINDGMRGSLNLSTGTIYITQVSGVYYATICGGSAYSWVTSMTYPIEGKVGCP
jgi:hypothetical protein